MIPVYYADDPKTGQRRYVIVQAAVTTIDAELRAEQDGEVAKDIAKRRLPEALRKMLDDTEFDFRPMAEAGPATVAAFEAVMAASS